MRSRRRDHRRLGSTLAVCAGIAAVVLLIALPAEKGNGPFESRFPAAADPLPAHMIEISVDALAAVDAVLAPGVHAPMPELASMAASIAAIGPDAIPVVVGMLCGSVAEPQAAHGTADQPVHPTALALRERVLFASVAYFDAKDVVKFLRDNAWFASSSEKLVYARLLGEIGTIDAQAALLELIADFEPVELQGDCALRTLEDALGRCVLGKQPALDALAKSAAQLDARLLPIVARAVGHEHRPESAAFLAQWLGKSAELDAVVLPELSRMGDASANALPESALAYVRRQIDHRDIRIARSAITLLGWQRDREAFEPLAGELDHADPLVIAAARWSLVRTCGADLGATADAWFTWRSSQETWWDERGVSLALDLASDDVARTLAALREWSDHPYYRVEGILAIGALASDARAPIATAAARALERLSSPSRAR